MELEAKGEGREGGTGLEERGEGTLVGQGRMTDHGDEVAEREEGVGVGRDEGCP